MINHLRDLSIQNKLFGAFSLTIVVAALSVVISLATLLSVQALVEDLVIVYENARSAYEAKLYLQEMERIQRSSILKSGLEDADSFLIYVALFEDYYRQAVLEASDPEIKTALYEIDRAKSEYLQSVETLTKSANSPEGLKNMGHLIERAAQEMKNLNNEITIISQHGWDAFDRAQSRQELFLRTAAAFNVFSLIIFLVMATIAILVISRGVFASAAMLRNAAKAVVEKNFSPELLDPVIVADDEMGELGQAFIQMAAAFDAREKELQSQIEDVRIRLQNYE